MDATALRWVLGIIGVLIIAGIYLYAQYQSNLRRRSAVRTFTREEIDVDFIEDDILRQELSNINTMLEQGLDKDELSEIKINPGLESGLDQTEQKISSVPQQDDSAFHLPPEFYQIDAQDLIAYVLKSANNQEVIGTELASSLKQVGFIPAQQGNSEQQAGYYYFHDQSLAPLVVANMTVTGSLVDIETDQFKSYGISCYFDVRGCPKPRHCYELMLKKIDELVRLMDFKVYDQDLHLLTLQQVTDIRQRLIDLES